MRRSIFYSLLGLIFLTIAVLVFAHEKTGWIAPQEAKKMKNPVKATKASIQKGKEIYEKNVPSAMATKGMEKDLHQRD